MGGSIHPGVAFRRREQRVQRLQRLQRVRQRLRRLRRLRRLLFVVGRLRHLLVSNTALISPSAIDGAVATPISTSGPGGCYPAYLRDSLAPAVIDIAVGAGYVYFEEEPGPERQPSC